MRWLALALLLGACGSDGGGSAPDAGDPDAELFADGSPGPDAALPPTRELACGNGSDDDGDTMVDCDDPDCDGRLACVQAACPAGFTRRVVEPVEHLPMVIPENDNLYLPFPGPAGADGMANVEMQISLHHPHAGTLQIEYYHPAGTLPLNYGGGGEGDRMDRTIFSDRGATTMDEGQAPWQGVFHPPDYAFALLRDYAVDPDGGSWMLHIANPGEGVGQLEDFAVSFCVCEDCEVGPSCKNEVDDDGNGVTDCDEPTCQDDRHCIPEIECADNGNWVAPITSQNDQDLDGLIDCRDPDCAGHAGCEFGQELTCDDGKDNDQDGFDWFSFGPADCQDPDCAGSVACQRESNCSNGVDDDHDGKTDCADAGCKFTQACGVAERSCSDGLDDDADGQVDCADGDCAGRLGCFAVTCPAGDTFVIAESRNVPLTYGHEHWRYAHAFMATVGRVDKVVVEVSGGGVADDTGDNYYSVDAPGFFPAYAGPLLSFAGGPFRHTVFDDAAAGGLSTGSAPYSGHFRGDDPLSNLNGLQAHGVWALEVANGSSGEDTSTVTGFAVGVCVCTTCVLAERCDNWLDDDGDDKRDCDDPDCSSRPICQ